MFLPSGFAAVLAVGMFYPLLGSEKCLQVPGGKPRVTMSLRSPIHPLVAIGNKSHGNEAAVNPGNYAPHFECTVAELLLILHAKGVQRASQKAMHLNSKSRNKHYSDF